jgi:hypothetical protein
MKNLLTLFSFAFFININAQTCTVTITSNPKDTLCSGQTTTLTASGATNYTWAPVASLNTSTGNTVIASPTVTTIYTITASTGTCTSVSHYTIIVFSLQPPPTFFGGVTSPLVMCQGYASPGIFVTTHTGNLPAWFQDSLLACICNPIQPLLNLGNNYFYVEDIDHTTGCLGEPLYLTIVLNAAPTVSFSIVTDSVVNTWDLYPVCGPGGTTPFKFTWIWGDGNQDVTPAPSHIYATGGTYTISVLMDDTVNHCESAFSQVVSLSTTGNGMAYVNVKPPVSGLESLNASDANFSIYPNPSNNVLHVKMAGQNATQIQIVEVLGNKVKSFDLKVVSEKTEIDISDLKEGIYFVSIKTKGETATQKIIVQR